MPSPIPAAARASGVNWRWVVDAGWETRVSTVPREAARRLVAATEVFTLAESLGGVESLIELPGEMTHASVAGTDAEVPADLVRLSVGVEHPDDLVADLARALDRA